MAIEAQTPTRPTADAILRANGFTGDRVIKLARRIANDAQRKAPSGLGGKYEDLVSFLLVQAMEAVVRFDPQKLGDNYTLSSWLCDLMERRVADWYRRKSEGFGDRRSGNDQRIILTGNKIDDQPAAEWEHHLEPNGNEDHEHRLWAQAAGTISTPMHDWDHITEAHAMRWTRAAQTLNLTLDVWIRLTLDIAANHQLNGDRQAA